MYNSFIKLQKEMISVKILIWLLCAFVPSAIQTVCKQGGYPLGAVESLILYAPAYWAAFKLCKVYDERKASKVAAAVAESPAPEELPAPQPEPAPTIADPTTPVPATPKLRFCKLCGAPIDPATRQCTGCGKQYFRPPVLRKKHLAIAAGVLACAAVALLIFNLIAQLHAAESKVEALNAQITDLNAKLEEQKDISHGKEKVNSALKSTFDDLQKRYDALRKENAMYREYLDYCESYCAYVTITGGKISSSIYHRLDCPYTEAADSLGILYIEFLESRDFTPCTYCYG